MLFVAERSCVSTEVLTTPYSRLAWNSTSVLPDWNFTSPLLASLVSCCATVQLGAGVTAMSFNTSPAVSSVTVPESPIAYVACVGDAEAGGFAAAGTGAVDPPVGVDTAWAGGLCCDCGALMASGAEAPPLSTWVLTNAAAVPAASTPASEIAMATLVFIISRLFSSLWPERTTHSSWVKRTTGVAKGRTANIQDLSKMAVRRRAALSQ